MQPLSFMYMEWQYVNIFKCTYSSNDRYYCSSDDDHYDGAIDSARYRSCPYKVSVAASLSISLSYTSYVCEPRSDLGGFWDMRSIRTMPGASAQQQPWRRTMLNDTFACRTVESGSTVPILSTMMDSVRRLRYSKPRRQNRIRLKPHG